VWMLLGALKPEGVVLEESSLGIIICLYTDP